MYASCTHVIFMQTTLNSTHPFIDILIAPCKTKACDTPPMDLGSLQPRVKH